jgi:hypothetical protein
MAADNLGFAEFLRNDELETRISEFYLRVRNPVLIQPSLTAVPGVLTRVAPFDLPNLYVGQQMIVAARYDQAVPITLRLGGMAFGMPVEYTYPVDLADSYDPRRAFLPKVWAKRTIESLMVLYYQYDEDSPQAQELEDQITQLSLTWGVISIFTSFNDNVDIREPEAPALPSSLLLVHSFPNPFNPSTTLRIQVPAGLPRGPLVITIYNIQGQRVRTLGLLAEGAGVYELVWDGKGENGRTLASGTYLVMVTLGDQLAAHRVTLLK